MENMVSYKANAKSQISHELRTPLTSIIGMAYFLSQTSLTPQQKEYVRFIKAEAYSLLSLENKLYNLVVDKRG